MKIANQIENLNFSGLDSLETNQVKDAIQEKRDFFGYIPAKGLEFITKNYKSLAAMGVLEENWFQAYTHASHFEDFTVDLIQEIFDACDKKTLQEKHPIYVGDHFSNGERFSLFRGCAGPNHKNGMSWTSSLDKAIWYAAHHAEYYGLTNVAVYATVVDRNEIYCCGDHYDYDFIVRPKGWWHIKIPESEFRLNRPR